MIYRKQCPIIWHLDDVKISHVRKGVIEDIIKDLDSTFVKECPLQTMRGKVLKYLGLTIDYRGKVKVKLSMFKYINKILEELPCDMEGILKTPAANHLFMTNEKCDTLSKDKAQLFHHLVTKLMYLCCNSSCISMHKSHETG